MAPALRRPVLLPGGEPAQEETQSPIRGLVEGITVDALGQMDKPELTRRPTRALEGQMKRAGPRFHDFPLPAYGHKHARSGGAAGRHAPEQASVVPPYTGTHDEVISE